jgi:hypothetical protein
MDTADEEAPHASLEISSKMDVLEESLAVLILVQNALDRANFSMSSIHLNNAIETLKADRVRLREQFKV